MARITLHPAIDTITGKIAGANFRRTDRGTLLVRPNPRAAAASALQVARRLAWQRLEQLLPQLTLGFRGSLDTFAIEADLDTHKYYLQQALTPEATNGFSATAPSDFFYPPLAHLFAIPWMSAGQIMIFWTAPGGPPAMKLAYALRHVPTLGQPATPIFAQIKQTDTPVSDGSHLIQALIPGEYYSIAYQQYHDLMHKHGQSVLVPEVQAYA